MSSKDYNEAYVWVWLPGATEPVVCGKLESNGGLLHFNYGRSYLNRDNSISIYEPELPLQSGVLPLLNGLTIPGCIRDASPDAWGRRVILNQKYGKKSQDLDSIILSELTYLLDSGSDRIGALDFQQSPSSYEPRCVENVGLEELLDAADRVEKGLPLSPELDRALCHGSSIGGARPKALIDAGDRKCIAKFSSTTDLYSVVKAEYVAMRLARLAGLDVASVEIANSLKKDVILIERFDRIKAESGWQRKIMISALTLFGLHELMPQYASYEDLAEIIRAKFMSPKNALRELFGRLVFNVLCGNSDDHARNHAAFWNGYELELTPAYDICPQNRSGNEVTQGMRIFGEDRRGQLQICQEAAFRFLLSELEADAIIDKIETTIQENYKYVCEEAKLSSVDQNMMWGRQFLNPFSLIRRIR